MAPKIKNLGLVIVAVATMSMAAAASAQASELHVTTQGSATITGQQGQQFVIQSSVGTVACTADNFQARVQSAGAQITAQELTVTPTLSGCMAFGLAATVQINGCKVTVQTKTPEVSQPLKQPMSTSQAAYR